MSMSMWVVLEHGEVPDSLNEGYDHAKLLGVNLDVLDRTAQKLGLKPLGSFVLDYVEEMREIWEDEDVETKLVDEAVKAIGSDGPWFNPDEGLLTLRGLIQQAEAAPDGEVGVMRDLVPALRSFAAELEHARQLGSQFHFGIEY